MTQLDPYRTLGVGPDAGQAEIKRAYRRLAKQYHPDWAGERQLSRFLAIQAAYEALVEEGPATRRGGGERPANRPTEPAAWRADPDRARATRDAYRTRRRGPASGGPAGGATQGAGPATGSGPGPTDRTDADGRHGSAGSASGTGPGTAAGSGPGSGTSGRSRRRPKATIGSTSYDGADREPFDPAWDGATWYGAGSGTYWTVNPKEYADPRKHGPEYLARSRRPGPGRRRAAPAAGGPEPGDGGTSTVAEEPRAGSPDDGPWSDPTDRSGAAASSEAAPPGATQGPASAAAGPSAGVGPTAVRRDRQPAASIRGRIRAAFGRSPRVR